MLKNTQVVASFWDSAVRHCTHRMLCAMQIPVLYADFIRCAPSSVSSLCTQRVVRGAWCVVRACLAPRPHALADSSYTRPLVRDNRRIKSSTQITKIFGSKMRLVTCSTYAIAPTSASTCESEEMQEREKGSLLNIAPTSASTCESEEMQEREKRSLLNIARRGLRADAVATWVCCMCTAMTSRQVRAVVQRSWSARWTVENIYQFC